jgi:hypothetical protein
MTRLLTFICLGASLAAQTPAARPRITGAAHMAYYVSDLAKAREYYKDFLTEDAKGLRASLAARGVKVSGAVSKDPAGDLSFDVTDPFEFTIQLVQYLPNSWTTRTEGTEGRSVRE